jgi:6-phosphogluconolactonase
MTPDVVVGPRADIEGLMASAVQGAAADGMAARGQFLLALSGGSIAPLFFPMLARLAIEWSRVDFFWVDERGVPPNDADSNFAEADRLWLTPAGVPPHRIHRIRGEDPDLRHAASLYAAELRRIAGNPPALDFAIMGCGPDGHVASLFPGHRALSEEREIAVAIDDAPKPPPRRVTLTLPVLAATRQIVVSGSSDEKAEVVRQALQAGSSLPLGLLIARAPNVRVLLVK